MEAYEDHTHSCLPHNPASHAITPYETTVFAVDLFQRVEDEISLNNGGASPPLKHGSGSTGQRSKFFINEAVELSTCWLRDVFDK